jgi:ABC-type metal ion transport system substrate-binding protein
VPCTRRSGRACATVAVPDAQAGFARALYLLAGVGLEKLDRPIGGNTYARVLVAPSRLAGDPRVSALAHALESPEVAKYLVTKYQGKFISARVPFQP